MAFGWWVSRLLRQDCVPLLPSLPLVGLSVAEAVGESLAAKVAELVTFPSSEGVSLEKMVRPCHLPAVTEELLLA